MLNKISDGVTASKARPVGTPTPVAIVPIKLPVTSPVKGGLNVEPFDGPVAGLAGGQTHQQIAVRIQQQGTRLRKQSGIFILACADWHGQIGKLAEACVADCIPDLVSCRIRCRDRIRDQQVSVAEFSMAMGKIG